MSRQHTSNRQYLIFSALLFSVGSACSALSQPLPKAPDASRSPNPRIIIKYITIARGDDRSKTRSAESPKLSPGDEKKAAIEQAIQDGNDAREANNYEKALASYRRVADELSLKDSRAAYGLGNVYYDLACTDQAIRAYSDALRLDGNFHDALIMLGYAYATKEDYDEAATQFRSVLKKMPDDIDAKIGLAYAISKKKQYEEAVKVLTLIVSNPTIEVKKRAVAYLRIGDIYLEQTKWDDAAVNLKKAIALDADLASAYVKLGQEPTASSYWMLASVYFSKARQGRSDADYEEAIKLSKKALEINPKLGAAYIILGNLYKFHKDGANSDEALANYEEAEKYYPQDASIKFLIADLFYSVKKNNDAAINYLKQAIKMRPNYIEAYRELAFVYHDKQQDDTAIEQLVTALSYNSKYLDAYLDLTNLYDGQKLRCGCESTYPGDRQFAKRVFAL